MKCSRTYSTLRVLSQSIVLQRVCVLKNKTESETCQKKIFNKIYSSGLVRWLSALRQFLPSLAEFHLQDPHDGKRAQIRASCLYLQMCI